MATWTFDLKCPRCGRENQITTENNKEPPTLKCSDCLMNHVEMVDFEIVRASVDVEGKI